MAREEKALETVTCGGVVWHTDFFNDTAARAAFIRSMALGSLEGRR